MIEGYFVMFYDTLFYFLNFPFVCIWMVSCWEIWILGGFFTRGWQFQGTDRVGGKFHPESSGNAFGDIDPMDMSDGMQEAMHRSHLEMRYNWVRARPFSNVLLHFFYNINYHGNEPVWLANYSSSVWSKLGSSLG